ncbi:DUF6114 domain-containing protein [Nocardioides jiangxiensis]|uniref:DUF6114 domain-containing protein n=1 Tax=Nocardioides jiangxiensis TaxID=3064524 RepID=A0ABT9AZD4_9ACTN|nr:DUF6114 domain-containing protein [Nocardioides sp. WY-20]MDO7867949.1 DUF6114 domain-containing protein [Nocardioides sp. WY-20]
MNQTRPSRIAALRHATYRYLKTRPTAGSLVLAAGAYFVLRPVVDSTFQFLAYLGTGGAQIYILGGGMLAAALVSFFMPAQRHFPALMAMAFSIASLPLANLGGWLIGMILGIAGSGMIFAWTPYSETQLAKIEEKRQRRLERRQGKQAKDPVAA